MKIEMNTEICSAERAACGILRYFFKVLAGLTPFKHAISLGAFFQWLLSALRGLTVGVY